MKTLTSKLDNAMKELNLLQRDIVAIQQRIPEAVTNYNMYKLMDDLKNGRVLLVHPDTMEPVRLNWIQSSPTVDDEGDAVPATTWTVKKGFSPDNEPKFSRSGYLRIIN